MGAAEDAVVVAVVLCATSLGMVVRAAGLLSVLLFPALALGRLGRVASA